MCYNPWRASGIPTSPKSILVWLTAYAARDSLDTVLPVRGRVMATKDAQKAKDALERAKQRCARASANPDAPDEVFVWSFYALENAVVAASIHAGAGFARNHWSKAAAARSLSQKHNLTDVSGLLADLNEARKGTAYGDVDEPELEPADALDQVGSYITEVEA